MINFTINNIKNIEDYRVNNYNLINEKISSINNLNEQYIKVNEQLKDNLSKKNKLIEKIQDYETQIELLTNKEKAIELQNKEFFELKLNELDIIKNLSYLKHDNNNYKKNIKKAWSSSRFINSNKFNRISENNIEKHNYKI